MSALFGFLVLALLEFLDVAVEPQNPVGKPEYVAWIFALLAFPWFALMPLPGRFSAAWGFVRAISPVAVVWFVYDRASAVSDSLHHGDPLILEVVGLVLLWAGMVPWDSWRTLFTWKPQRTKA